LIGVGEGRHEPVCHHRLRVGAGHLGDRDRHGHPLGALVLIPFVDRGRSEPRSWAEAFNLRERGWALALIVVL
jgi:hypothetical protein